jgi:antitoxin HicB
MLAAEFFSGPRGVSDPGNAPITLPYTKKQSLASARITLHMLKHRTITAGEPLEYGYTVVFEPLPEGGLNVFVPALPEICTYGETMEEARAMARDAIRCYLESALETGEYIPNDVKELTTERVEVTIP